MPTAVVSIVAEAGARRKESRRRERVSKTPDLSLLHSLVRGQPYKASSNVTSIIASRWFELRCRSRNTSLSKRQCLWAMLLCSGSLGYTSRGFVAAGTRLTRGCRSAGVMVSRLQFENNNEIGVFSMLSSSYALVALGASENFYR